MNYQATKFDAVKRLENDLKCVLGDEPITGCTMSRLPEIAVTLVKKIFNENGAAAAFEVAKNMAKLHPHSVDLLIPVYHYFKEHSWIFKIWTRDCI